MPLVKDVGRKGARSSLLMRAPELGRWGATRASNRRCRGVRRRRVGTNSGAAAHEFLLRSCVGEGDWRVEGAVAPVYSLACATGATQPRESAAERRLSGAIRLRERNANVAHVLSRRDEDHDVRELRIDSTGVHGRTHSLASRRRAVLQDETGMAAGRSRFRVNRGGLARAAGGVLPGVQLASGLDQIATIASAALRQRAPSHWEFVRVHPVAYAQDATRPAEWRFCWSS